MNLLMAVNALPQGVLVACSGGRDSVALLHACVAADRSPRAVTIDHQLSPHGADAAEHVAQLCSNWAVPHRTVPVVVAEGDGPEDAARRARYAALNAEAQRLNAPVVVLAHTADDQLETVLMRLADGAGAAGLAGMPSARGIYRRPWLHIRRTAVAAYAETYGLEWIEDPTNATLNFRRNRVRHLLMPALTETFGVGWATGVLRTAQTARLAANDQMKRLAHLTSYLANGRIEIDSLQALSPGDRRVALIRMCALLPPRRQASAADTLEALLARPPGVAHLDLAGPWQAERAYGWLTVRRVRPVLPTPSALQIDKPGRYLWGRWRIVVGEDGVRVPGTAPFVVRARERGERYRPQNAQSTRSIARLLINAKVPRIDRDRPVVCDAAGIVWVPPLAVAHGRPAPSRPAWGWRIELS